MKIAPTLRWHIDSKRFGSTMDALRNDSAQMRKELRALLAVVRAAASDDIWYGVRGEPGLLPGWKRLDRALARLDKLSGRTP